VQRNDPQGAIMWVAGISDEETRRKELTNYAQRWIRKDETAARSWISNSDLPQETKDHLLKED
jgi:Na+-transporting NADH:ubiquinone oxidoreductase subunit NqrC